MKRRTTPVLQVEVGIDVADVASVDFLIKQENSEYCTTSVKKTYPDGGADYDAQRGVFLLSYTAAETAVFAPNSTIWLDTRITLISGKVPATEMVRLFMDGTLFSLTDIEDETEGGADESD